MATGCEFVAVIDDAFGRIDLGEVAIEVVFEMRVANRLRAGVCGIDTLSVKRPEIEPRVAAEEANDGDERGKPPEKTWEEQPGQFNRRIR